MRKQQTLEQMNQAVAAFNSEHAIGDVIRCWPGTRHGEPVERTIVHPGAYVLGGHTAVVQVSGGGGCISLAFVSPGKVERADIEARQAVEGEPV